MESTFRRQPQWRFEGRGGDQVIEFRRPEGPSTVHVRARILSSRPVPEGAPDADSFRTHCLEYIVGGSGQVWVRLDEVRKTVRIKAQDGPDASASRPASPASPAAAPPDEAPEDSGEAALPSPGAVCGHWVLPYRIVEAKDADDPAPGHYGVVSVASRFARDPAIVLGSKSFPTPKNRGSPDWESRQALIQQRRDRGRAALEGRRQRGPEPTSYTPPTASRVLPTARMPVYGFGSASRLPTVKRQQGPEPGDYAPKPCWDGMRVTVRGRIERSYESAPGLEPANYDSLRGLAVTRAKEPVPKLGLSGERSTLVTSTAPGPGEYDAKFTLVHRRDRQVRYYDKKGEPKLPPTLPPDPHFGRFSVIA